MWIKPLHTCCHYRQTVKNTDFSSGAPRTMNNPPIFRFAPSPNGRLHPGHAYSALVNWHMARQTGGRFLLRIEDVDGGRARDEYIEQIFEDLAWLGLEWEKPVLKQSEHMHHYATALARLDKMGLLYPCFATRREILEHPRTRSMPENPDGVPIYPGLYRDVPEAKTRPRIEAGEPHTLRLDMQKALAIAGQKVGEISFRERRRDGSCRIVKASPACWGDVVLARKDIPTSYSLAVVVDDARQGITHVVRGEDLRDATSLHRLLQILLDLPEPLYFHHPLVVDRTGRKLSKSDRDISLAALRANGITPQQLIEQLPPLYVQEHLAPGSRCKTQPLTGKKHE